MRTGIVRGPPVVGSVRAGSCTKVERIPTGCRPVGRGIDSPTPPEDTSGGPPRDGPAIVSMLRSGAAAADDEATPTAAESPHAATIIRDLEHRCHTTVMALPPGRGSPPAEPPRPRRWHRPGVVPSL